MLPVNSGFHKLKRFSENYPHFEYQFQGEKLVAFRGTHVRVHSSCCRSATVANALAATSHSRQLVPDILSQSWLYTAIRASFRAFWLCFVAGEQIPTFRRSCCTHVQGPTVQEKCCLNPTVQALRSFEMSRDMVSYTGKFYIFSMQLLIHFHLA
jgi:hypothetical protein